MIRDRRRGWAALVVALATTGAAPPAAAAPADPPAAPPPAALTAPAEAADATAARGRVRGVVTGPDRRPAGGRLVVLVSQDEQEALRVTSTDEKGRYQFRDLPPGKYAVRLEADGFEPEVKSGIEVRPPFQNVVDVTLRRPATGSRLPAATGAGAAPEATPPGVAEPGAAAVAGGGEVVRGILRDSDGAPVVEAEVLLAPLGPGRLREGASDREGGFRIEEVAPGGYRLIVRSLGHVPIDVGRVEVKPGGGLSLRLTLVDYALDFVSGATRPIPERPRARPAAGAAAPGAPKPAPIRALAPEPEPDPLVPPPPEEKSTTPPPAGGEASRASPRAAS